MPNKTAPRAFFRTHKGEIVKGKRLSDALASVADEWETLGYRIRNSADYASHVTEQQKDASLAKHLEAAQKVRRGVIDNFTMWQRVNTKLTSECVAFLP